MPSVATRDMQPVKHMPFDNFEHHAEPIVKDWSEPNKVRFAEEPWPDWQLNDMKLMRV